MQLNCDFSVSNSLISNDSSLNWCSLLGTDNVRGQISVHIFASNGDYCLYKIFEILDNFFEFFGNYLACGCTRVLTKYGK